MTLGRRATEAALAVVLMGALAITVVPTPVAGTLGTVTTTTDTTLTEDHFGNIVIAAASVTPRAQPDSTEPTIALLEDETPEAYVALSGLRSLVEMRDLTPETLTRPITPVELENARFLALTGLTVSYGFAQPYSASEISDITAWVQAGGSLFLYGDINAWRSLNPLTAGLGIEFNADIISDKTNNSEGDELSPVIHVFASHPISKDVQDIVFFLGVSMELGDGASGIAFTDDDSSPPNAPVLAAVSEGNGQIVAIGDGNAVNDWGIQQPFDNHRLLRNIVAWLVNTPPTASFIVTPSAGETATIFTMDAFASSDLDDPVTALEVRWDWENDGLWDTAWMTPKTAEHQYAETGIFTIHLEVRDTRELTSQTTRQVVVTNEPPVTTVSLSGTAGEKGWFTSPVAVTLSATDDLSGVASIAYRLDGDAWEEYAGPITVDGDGIHMVEYYSTDNARNAEAVTSFDIKIDSTGPQTSLSLDGTLGENGWYTSTVTVTLAASDATSGVATISYRIDGGPWQTYSAPFTMGEGEHTLEYRATDVAGNEEAVNSAPLKVDTRRPTITIVAPGADSILDSITVSVSGTASDGFSVDRMELSTDGTNWVLATGTTSWSGTLTLVEGANTIYARATDEAGNTETTSITVTVEIPSPRFQVSPSVVTYVGIGAVAAVAAVAALLLWRRRAGGKRKG